MRTDVRWHEFARQSDNKGIGLQGLGVRSGTQVAFARRHRLDRTHLNQVLKGKSRISRSVLKCLGLRKVYTLDQIGNPVMTAEAYALVPALEQVDTSIS